MKSLKVKFGLLDVLTKLVGREFTVDDLTEAYLDDPACPHKSKKSARQFVYRNMLRLIDSDDMSRVVVDQGWPLYKLTSKFLGNHKLAPPAVTPPKYQQQAEPPVPKADPRQNLQERLNRHKLEMLSAMGETEEYDAICAEIPELRDEVQVLYNASRDKCSRLLGRVKALESLLARETGVRQ